MSSPEIMSDPPKPKGEQASDIRSDPRWQLVERILLTGPFQKSPNLHALLSSLAEYSIRGRADGLTERQVGVAVFGKPASYSPAEDSAVRVYMRQLRLRLHEYFDEEGRHEIQRVDIPKGSYVLEFQRGEPESEPLPTLALAAPPWITRRIAFREVLFWPALVVAVVCALGWYHTSRASVAAPVPWPLNAVIQQDRQTRIVLSDSSTMLRQLGDHEITLDQYLRPDFRESLIPAHLDANFSRLVDYIAGSQLTSFADVMAASTVIKLVGTHGDQLSVSSARDLNERDLEKGNYIFVGSRTSNPWVSLFADRLNFEVAEDGVGGRMYFRNKNPLPGEQSTYQGLAQTGSAGEDYATLSLLPSSIGQGNILILQGLRQEGTEALGALLADSNDRAQLERALDIRGDTQNPPYFEALIRARAVAGAPVSIQIVTVRRIHR
jgi:hypothetical protein